MLPEGVLLGDLEHMQNDNLKAVFDHIVRMEQPEDGAPPRRFRLSSYRTGRGKKASYLPAKYTPPAPPVAKKARSTTPSTIITGPRDEDEHPAPVLPKKPTGAKKTSHSAAVSNLPESQAASGPSGGAVNKGKGVDRAPESNPVTQQAQTVRGLQAGAGEASVRSETAARWDALEKQVGEDDNDVDGLDSSLTDLDSTVGADDDEPAGPIPTEHSRPSRLAEPEVDVGILYPSPTSVGNDGKQRYEFLSELSGHREYLEMLLRVRSSVRRPCCSGYTSF